MYHLGNLKIEILEDYAAMSKRGAKIIASQMSEKEDSVIGFATGSTPIGTYKELIALYESKKVDFSKITTFNLDEYYPIQQSNDQSYFYFMDQQLFKHVNIDYSKVNLPNGETKNVAEECKLYEQKIQKAGGVDLQLLGIGLNGHIGFNEPNDFFDKETHLVDLQQSTVEANSRLFNSIDEVPRQALTMGIKTILMAKKVLLLINGKNKAQIAKDLIFANISPQIPATALQLHHDVTILLDQEAATLLEKELASM